MAPAKVTTPATATPARSRPRAEDALLALWVAEADAELDAREVVPAAARLVETPETAEPEADEAAEVAALETAAAVPD